MDLVLSEKDFSAFYCDVTILPFFRKIYFLVKLLTRFIVSSAYFAKVQKCMFRNARTAAFSDQLIYFLGY